jgi:spermidine synthase
LFLGPGLISLLVIILRIVASFLIIPGQLLSFEKAFLLLIAPLLILCPTLGWLFITGQKSFKSSLNLAYFWETIGFFIAGLLFSFFLAGTSFPLPRGINATSLGKLYPGLKQVVNSTYQQAIETELSGQTNIYLSGQLAFSSQQEVENEQVAGLVFPLTSLVDKVLVVGNPNLASTLALYPKVRQIEFLELDPTVLSLERNFLNPRIEPMVGDLKVYLVKNPLVFDLLVINLPPPASLFLNRFYTQEFFKIAKASLTTNGSLVLIFYLPTDYQSQEALRFARGIYQTFVSIFDKNYFLSLEDQVVLIGGKEKIEPNEKEADFLEKIYPSFSRGFFDYQITKPGRSLLLEKLQPKAEINRDDFPIAFLYRTLFWQTLFNFQLPKLFYALRFWSPLIFLAIVLVVFSRAKESFRQLLVVSTSSFILMSLQIILIFLFQVKFGSVYSQIAFLIGLVLLGMAGGVRGTRRKGERRGVLGYFLVMIGIFCGLKGNLGIWFWWLIALVLGFTGGFVFARISNWFSRKKEQPLVYSFDLLGAFLGAILTGPVFFPVLGLKNVFLLLAGLVAIVWHF